MYDAYREDLAFIHDLGFGDMAVAAADALLPLLAGAGFAGGTVVDLGCGSGILAERMVDAGFDVLGVDISPAMIELAQQRVPSAAFTCESWLRAELPPCVAVAAVGECFNYRFDPGLFRRVHGALAPGGVLLFDAAGPGRVPGTGPLRTFVDGGDWTVLMTAEEDPEARSLVRRITSFRSLGELYRRDDEIHELELHSPGELLEELSEAGFEARVLSAYGRLTLPPGLAGFLAQRPGDPARTLT